MDLIDEHVIGGEHSDTIFSELVALVFHPWSCRCRQVFSCTLACSAMGAA